MIFLTAVVVIAAVALIMVNQKKPAPAPVAVELNQRPYAEPVLMRSRASWEVETEEDLDVIRDRYWQHRRQVRADEAMTRLGDLVPATASKSK